MRRRDSLGTRLKMRRVHIYTYTYMYIHMQPEMPHCTLRPRCTRLQAHELFLKVVLGPNSGPPRVNQSAGTSPSFLLLHSFHKGCHRQIYQQLRDTPPYHKPLLQDARQRCHHPYTASPATLVLQPTTGNRDSTYIPRSAPPRAL